MPSAPTVEIRLAISLADAEGRAQLTAITDALLAAGLVPGTVYAVENALPPKPAAAEAPVAKRQKRVAAANGAAEAPKPALVAPAEPEPPAVEDDDPFVAPPPRGPEESLQVAIKYLTKIYPLPGGREMVDALGRSFKVKKFSQVPPEAAADLLAQTAKLAKQFNMTIPGV